MLKSNSIRGLSFAAICVGLAACAGPQPVAYSGIGSASYMKPNTGENSGKVPYSYSTQTNWSSYTNVIVDPVVVYQGADNQFGTLSADRQTELARYMGTQFTTILSKRFAVTSTPAPNTLRVTLTLTGAATSKPVISTFAHIDMGGNVYNAVEAARGKGGLATGWVMYTVEIHDASTGQLLEAFETKQYPNAFNIAATFGSMKAAKDGVDKGANTLEASLQ